MSKIKIFATKAFSSSADQTDRYDVLGPGDLTQSDQRKGVRQIPQAERCLRGGRWPFGGFPLFSSLRGRKVGILRLGRIGGAIAQRVSAIGPEVAYCNRTEKPGAPNAHYPDALSSCFLGAAGPGVFANEPHVRDALIKMDNVFLLPQIGSAASTTCGAMGDDRALANLESCFGGNRSAEPRHITSLVA